MIEKLELKHIAGYLPYDLSCNISGEFVEGTEYEDSPIAKIIKIEGANNSHIEVWNLKTITYEFCYEDVFPILRPLSDLTKEIEVDGEKLRPIDFLSKRSRDDYYECTPRDKPNIKWWAYKDIQKIQKWHFDIHGLIEAKLAIDINTL